MTNKQYHQLLKNRRRADVRPLFRGALEGRLLRAAGRTLRRRVAAEAALQAILPDGLLKLTRVEGLEQGTLTVTVADQAGWRELRRLTPQLRTQLARVVPGFRQLRARPAPPAGPLGG
jgi:hypothetical protein